MPEVVDTLIVGAGPSGLATAIACVKAGLSYRIIEKGTLVNSIFQYPRNMVFFTTPELLEIGGLPFTTPYEKPTRVEALRYYRRVADTYGLQICFNEEVQAVVREAGNGADAVLFRTETCRAGQGRATYYSRAVVMAIGYYDNPNMLGVPGEDLPHVFHYYRDAHPYYRKQVVVVGGRNSAAEAALDLYRSGAKVTLLHRGIKLSDAIKYWVRPDIVNRLREGSIAARFNTCVLEIRKDAVVCSSAGHTTELPAEAVFLLTGYHPDVLLLRRSGVDVDEASLAPVHNSETLETNVRGLFLAGAVVSGKNTNRVFIENGRFHGESVVRTIRDRLREQS